MKKNMGSTDRVIRIVVAVVIAGLFFANIISGLIGYVLLGIGVVFLLTASINFCPLYQLFGIKTNGSAKH